MPWGSSCNRWHGITEISHFYHDYYYYHYQLLIQQWTVRWLQEWVLKPLWSWAKQSVPPAKLHPLLMDGSWAVLTPNYPTSTRNAASLGPFNTAKTASIIYGTVKKYQTRPRQFHLYHHPHSNLSLLASAWDKCQGSSVLQTRKCLGTLAFLDLSESNKQWFRYPVEQRPGLRK